MKTSHLIAGLIVCAPLAAASPALAAKICVDQKNEACLPTIQEGVDAALAGDVVEISAHTYTENVTVPSGKDGLVLAGAGNATNQTVIDGDLSDGADEEVIGDTLAITSNGVTVKNLQLRNGNADGIDVTGDDFTARNVVVRGPGEYGIYVDGHRARVLACEVYSTGSASVSILGDDALVQDGHFTNADDDAVDIEGNGAVVENNRTEMTADSGIYIRGDLAEVVDNVVKVAYEDDGIDVEGADMMIKRNKVIGGYYDNIDADCVGSCSAAVVANNNVSGSDDDYGIDIGADADGMLVKNNVVKNTAYAGINVGGQGVTVSGNRVSRSTWGDDDEGCISIEGIDATVENNAVENCGTQGIRVEADNATVRGNQISGGQSDGIEVFDSVGSLIENNTISDTVGVGVELDVDAENTTVTGNTAKTVRNGFCDLGTGTTESDNTFKRVFTPGAAGCPVDPIIEE